MPFESEAQRRAMYAAAQGNSTIGIPQDAARSFIKHSGGTLPTVQHSTGTKSRLKEELRRRRARAREG